MNPAVARKPRAVIVTRKSLYTLLIERHGTVGQAAFYLKSRGEYFAPYEESHQRLEQSLAVVDGVLAPDQRRTRVDRDELDRFLFAPDDLIIIVGQDGLVPNVAKYLRGQPVIGVNPDPDRYDGILCAHRPAHVKDVLSWLQSGNDRFHTQRHAMASAMREDGQRLLALNEVFVGHRTHQSARYRLIVGERVERQSSSGLICSTGTGATGWARSICTQRKINQPLTSPQARSLAWYVREPFPSVASKIGLNFGVLTDEKSLKIVSEMSDHGVMFADGIETDYVEFVSGQSVEIRLAEETLNLIMPSTPTPEPQSRAPHKTAAGPGSMKRAQRP